MKILFLDIDGVLNSAGSVVARLGPPALSGELVKELANLDGDDFKNGIALDQECRDASGLDFGVREALVTHDPVAIALLNQVLRDPDVGLVLSSSHRMFLCHAGVPFRSSEHLRRLRLYLTALGVEVPTMFDATPVMHTKRGNEINAWLSHAYEEGIVSDGDPYVIVDDASDMLDGQPFVRTDPAYGFSFNEFSEVCYHLGLKEPGLVFL